jgi:hypothetical protein
VSCSGAEGHTGEAALFVLAFDIITEGGSETISVMDNPNSTAPFADSMTNNIPHSSEKGSVWFFIGEEAPSGEVPAGREAHWVATSRTTHLTLREMEIALLVYPVADYFLSKDKKEWLDLRARRLMLTKILDGLPEVRSNEEFQKAREDAYSNAASRLAMEALMGEVRRDNPDDQRAINIRLSERLDREYPVEIDTQPILEGRLPAQSVLCEFNGTSITFGEFLEYASIEIEDASAMEPVDLDRALDGFLLKRRTSAYAKAHLLEPGSEAAEKCEWRARSQLYTRVIGTRAGTRWENMTEEEFAEFYDRHPEVFADLDREEAYADRMRFTWTAAKALFVEAARELEAEYEIRSVPENLLKVKVPTKE